jgi:pyruvate/2-oxoglutarate dehydrogenase complex dihydrolipoamide acyltransferase (E2) component
MHPLLVCALIALYGWLSLHWLPFLLVMSGGCLLGYMLLESVFTKGAPPMSTRRKLMLSTWHDQTEAQVYGIISVNADPLLAYLDAQARVASPEGDSSSASAPSKISVTTACIKAVAMAMKEAPGLNSRIVFGQFVPRPSVDVSCLVALDDGTDLAVAKLNRCDTKTLGELHADMKAKADRLRKHKDKDFEVSNSFAKSGAAEFVCVDAEWSGV